MMSSTASASARPLRLLLLCTSDQGGGAAEAARRQLEALTQAGVEVRLLVLHRQLEEEHIGTVAPTRLARLRAKGYFLAERLEIYLRNGRSRQHLFRFSSARWGFDVSQHPWVKWADVLHLHWINQGFLSLAGLERLSQLGKPIFATLHDLWMATGGCHLPLSLDRLGASACPRYEVGCGCCPLLGSARQEDFSRALYLQKRFLAQAPFRYIAVSSFVAQLFTRSALGRGQEPPLLVPNPIDADLFSPATARALPSPVWYDPQRLYLTIVAARLDEAVKGPALLQRIARELREMDTVLAERITFVLVGGMRDSESFADLALPRLELGSVTQRETLASIYAHSAILLSTSLFETFGQTLVEALAVGTPVVSFRCGGPEDIIQDGVNGRLVPAYDTEAYARALVTILQQRALAPSGAYSPEVCRTSTRPFSAGAVAEQLLDHYRQSLDD